MPLDRGIIDQQLQTLGESSRWWDQRELRDLPAILDPTERILALARGKVARLRWLRRSWLIVITDRRLLCVRSAPRSGWRQHELNADQIARVALRIGPFRGRVLVIGGGQSYRLLVPKADAYELAAVLSSIATSRQSAIPGFGPSRVVRRVIEHVLALPAAAFNPYDQEQPVALPAPAPETEHRAEALEQEIDQLKQQVQFLEELLRQRQSPEIEKGPE